MNSNSLKKESKSYIISALPVIFLVSVFLFAIHAVIVKTGLDGMFWYGESGYTVDVYAYFRMQIFIVLSIISVVYLIISALSGSAKVYKNKVYIPMLIYVVMVFISYMASDYKHMAAVGFYERYENTFVLIGYMAITFYAMNMINDERAFKLIFYIFSACCAVLGIWGVLQTFEIDIYSLPSWLYMNSEISQMTNLKLSGAADSVRWFFTNQNYSSFFMVFPICVSAMLIIWSQKIQWKIAFTVLLALMFYSLFNAKSLGGMVGVAVSAIAGLIVFNKKLIEWKTSVVLIIIAGIVSAAVSLPSIMGEIGSVTPVASLFSKTAYADDAQQEGLKYVDIDYVVTDGNNIIFNFAGTEVTIKTESGRVLGVYGADGSEIGLNTDYMQISEGELEDTGYKTVNVKTANATWSFADLDGELYFVTPTGKGAKLDKVESFGFENSQDFATYRGYIWSRTLPLIKDTILIGHGADTFALYFPQADYAGKYNIGYFSDATDIVIDKPHNMYLGMAVNTGVISLIAALCIFAFYLIDSFKIYSKNEYSGFISLMGAGVFVAVCGFLVAGLVNDSTVQVMPTFYALLGTGFAANRVLKEKK